MKFCCVVVTYNPDIEYFKRVLASISANHVNIMVVDNDSANLPQLEALSDAFTLISCATNIGIAAAQNLGIQWAIDHKVDYVWLSDQDTLYQPDFLEEMQKSIDLLNDGNVNFAVVAPSFFELNRNKIQPFFRFGLWTQQFLPKLGMNEVSHLISSGMMIPTHVFAVIGNKREDLFIDWVDLEWCWRAKKFGYKVIGTGDVVIHHNLGDEMVSVLDKKISVRSTFRHYFIVRNGIYLCLYSDLLPFFIRIEYFFRSLAFVIVYPLLAKKNKWEHLKACILGLWDGLTGRLGPKP